ncbi:CamS family sex pheromone protein [Peribacillus cavernae]|uniref:CamS family sex pheromone protein n=1 Tax=Peribacillus cavernae TaxID=1674310 RepID=A0A433HG71_9BACI|nr:CamS family sex pheromone protein [Peribacillus cavernae]MDQ0219831.1 protein involved in sex pheromone biosynthesis [Peribacillus cavernae]RUQ27222.1 CamS family sex pheromone protein [Peribacillus cavernae]
MKKSSFIGLILLLLLAGCAPKFEKQQEIVPDTAESKNKSEEKAVIIPNYNISDKYYRTFLPFKPAKARGLVVSNLNTRYDIEEFETGLMRIAQNQFDPDQYLFQEGQNLDKETVNLWLNRKFTKEQLKDEGLKSTENIGLNPLDSGKGDLDTRNQENPIYLAHILEHDYLLKDKNNKVRLGGVVIGLALNSVNYYQKKEFGATYSNDVKKREQEGRKIAAEVLQRLRKMDNLKQVPITIALFEQKQRSSVVPGNFISYTNVDEGSSKIDKWEEVNERYYVFPADDKTKSKFRADVNAFDNFKQDVEKYFPNFNGVIGRAFYVDDQLQELDMNIPIQFYGKSEAVGFTQYVTGLVMQHFQAHISVQVSITSVNGPEALIVRKANQDEPFVHIYH